MQSVLPKLSLSGIVEKIIAGLILMLITAGLAWFRSQRFRLLIRSATTWLRSQWQYLVIVILLILVEAALYLVYTDWEIIAFSVLHFAAVAIVVAVWLWSLQRRTTDIRDSVVYDFRFGLHGWRFPGAWSPQISKRGVQLIRYDHLQNDQNTMLVHDTVTWFQDGVIECEVYLEQGAFFNVVLRGNLAPGEFHLSGKIFYMARVDTRPSWYDCFLYQQMGRGWTECNDPNQLRDREMYSPYGRWLTMRIEVNEQRMSLYRDGQLVDQIDNAEVTAGSVGLFAEEANVYVRKVRITPASN